MYIFQQLWKGNSTDSNWNQCSVFRRAWFFSFCASCRCFLSLHLRVLPVESDKSIAEGLHLSENAIDSNGYQEGPTINQDLRGHGRESTILLWLMCFSCAGMPRRLSTVRAGTGQSLEGGRVGISVSEETMWQWELPCIKCLFCARTGHALSNFIHQWCEVVLICGPFYRWRKMLREMGGFQRYLCAYTESI